MLKNKKNSLRVTNSMVALLFFDFLLAVGCITSFRLVLVHFESLQILVQLRDLKETRNSYVCKTPKNHWLMFVS